MLQVLMSQASPRKTAASTARLKPAVVPDPIEELREVRRAACHASSSVVLLKVAVFGFVSERGGAGLRFCKSAGICATDRGQRHIVGRVREGERPAC
jgi:hypothetical protein